MSTRWWVPIETCKKKINNVQVVNFVQLLLCVVFRFIILSYFLINYCYCRYFQRRHTNLSACHMPGIIISFKWLCVWILCAWRTKPNMQACMHKMLISAFALISSSFVILHCFTMTTRLWEIRFFLNFSLAFFWHSARMFENSGWILLLLNIRLLLINFNNAFESWSHLSKQVNWSFLFRYQCNEGYMLLGNAELTCQNDGQWSSEPPVCVRTTCPVSL